MPLGLADALRARAIPRLRRVQRVQGPRGIRKVHTRSATPTAAGPTGAATGYIAAAADCPVIAAASTLAVRATTTYNATTVAIAHGTTAASASDRS